MFCHDGKRDRARNHGSRWKPVVICLLHRLLLPRLWLAHWSIAEATAGRGADGPVVSLLSLYLVNPFPWYCVAEGIDRAVLVEVYCAVRLGCLRSASRRAANGGAYCVGAAA